MAAHSSVLAWRIPGTAEPGGLPSKGLHRVGRTEATQQQQQPSVIFLCGTRALYGGWIQDFSASALDILG